MNNCHKLLGEHVQYIAYLNLQKSQHFQERASYIYLLGMFYLACNKLTLALENFISLASIDVQILPKL